MFTAFDPASTSKSPPFLSVVSFPISSPYLTFVDLTKTFDRVSRKGLFKLIEKIKYPLKLLSVIVSFHEEMKGTVQFEGLSCAPFTITRGVKQGCLLAPTLFRIFFPSCCPMPSVHRKMWPSIHDLTASCFSSHDCERRPRFAR